MPIFHEHKISIIIPARNEATQLPLLLARLKASPDFQCVAEIIVSDGKSMDETVIIARKLGAEIVSNEITGRGTQMNEAAKHATGNILYFLHADSFPPPKFLSQIIEKVDAGYIAGCFRLRFDYGHWFLRANAWFTRLNIDAVRFGDQSLFVRKDVFETVHGYRADLIIMEDQEIISRIRKKGRFAVIADYVTTSARKYRINGVYRMQAIFFYIYFSYKFGASQESLVKKYRKHIRN